jgi:hypothetical protein
MAEPGLSLARLPLSATNSLRHLHSLIAPERTVELINEQSASMADTNALPKARFPLASSISNGPLTNLPADAIRKHGNSGELDGGLGFM